MSGDAPAHPSDSAPDTDARRRRKHRKHWARRWLRKSARYVALYAIGLLVAAYATYWIVQRLDQTTTNEVDP